ncbi:hypothetical protein AB4Y40_29915 [Paraburkholderia sp. EG287B]|uniref:hypothetical protein n=1 Tax=Paraburkholderia sp. EG287B TaxID=3237010 RepID=UPI0034D15DD9
MNIAFQAFLLILFYLPGALFILGLTGRIFSDDDVPLVFGSISSNAGLALAAAAIIHLIGALVVAVLPNGLHAQIGASTFFDLVSSDTKAPAYQKAQNIIENSLGCEAAYFLFAAVLSFAVGYGLYRLQDRLQLDRKFPSLRFKPHWHYVLSASGPAAQNQVVLVDFLVDVSGTAVLYTGLLNEYTFDKETKQLDTLFLTDTLRSVWDITSAVGKDPVSLPVGLFCLKFEEVKNFTVTYISRQNIQGTQPNQTAALLPQATSATQGGTTGNTPGP